VSAIEEGVLLAFADETRIKKGHVIQVAMATIVVHLVDRK
jgi:hypothetical protein